MNPNNRQRVFISVEIPAEIKEKLASLAWELPAANIPLKPVKPENLHITLKFLGEVSEKSLDEIIGSIRETAYGRKQFGIIFSGAGVFPSIGKPGVFWAGIKDRGAGLVSMNSEMEDRLKKLGFQREERPYHPHITVARFGKKMNREGKKILQRQLSDKQNRSFGSMRINRISLMESTLTEKGAVYSLLSAADFYGAETI